MFLSNLFGDSKESQHKKANVEIYQRSLLSAVAGGALTEEQKHQLSIIQGHLGLEYRDIVPLRIEALRAAVIAAKRDGAISEEDEAGLTSIKRYLGIYDQEVPWDIQSEIAKGRTIHTLRNGTLPPVIVLGLILTKGESAYWSEPGRLYEEKVVSRTFENNSVGVSFRLTKRIRVQTGQSHGEFFSKSAYVVVSSGKLVFTNKRIIFMGNAKSFATSLDKIIDMNPMSDGLRFSETNHEKPRLIGFDQPNGDMVCEVINRIINKLPE